MASRGIMMHRTNIAICRRARCYPIPSGGCFVSAHEGRGTHPLMTWGVREPTNLIAPPGQAFKPDRCSNTFRWRHLASEEEEFGAVLPLPHDRGRRDPRRSLDPQPVVMTQGHVSHLLSPLCHEAFQIPLPPCRRTRIRCYPWCAERHYGSPHSTFSSKPLPLVPHLPRRLPGGRVH